MSAASGGGAYAYLTYRFIKDMDVNPTWKPGFN